MSESSLSLTVITQNGKIATLEKENAELRQQLAQAQARRGDGLCYYCGYPTNSLSSNPSNWPLVLCHSDEPGVPKYHHVGCVSDRLIHHSKLDRCVTALAFYSDPKRWEQCHAVGNVCDSIEDGDPMMVFLDGEDHPWSVADEALKGDKP